MADDAGPHSPIGNGTKHFLISPNDTTDLPQTPRAIYVCTAGDIVMRDANGDDVTYVNIVGLINFRPIRVLATGTTATNIIAWY